MGGATNEIKLYSNKKERQQYGESVVSAQLVVAGSSQSLSCLGFLRTSFLPLLAHPVRLPSPPPLRSSPF